MRRTVVGAIVVACVLALVGVGNVGSAMGAPRHGRGPGLLPAGYLSTSGSQLVPQGRRAPTLRIAAVNWPEDLIAPFQTLAQNVSAMRRAGFNTVTISWFDGIMHREGQAFWDHMDAMVEAAGDGGMKVIFNHHTDEGMTGTKPDTSCWSQQANGLWYDLGPGTDGTDGCGDPGTVTKEVFRSDWEQIARRYAGNPTVIGFDLDNEPLPYPGMSTWGDGGIRDIRAMYSRVGSALEAIDPGVLIICEGLFNWTGSFAGGPGVNAREGDLTMVASLPVTLNVNRRPVTDKVVYSVHEYPKEIEGLSEPAAVAHFNTVWGYLVGSNIAPVWIGEAGSSMRDDDNLPTDNPTDAEWARILTGYVNGRDGAMGGLTFARNQRGISTTWWRWGYHPGEQPDGTLNSDGTLKQDQFRVYCQWQTVRRPGCPG